MYRINYCIPTYKSFDECKTAVKSLLYGSIIPDNIVIIDNSGDGSGAIALQELTDNKRVIIWPQTYNLGVAASWNKFMRELAQDYVIIGNDDVFVHTDTIKILVDTAEKRQDAPLIYSDNNSGNAYSLFLLKQWGFEAIGPFDEHFYPGYFEDNDYERRRELAGFPVVHAHGATFDHIGSSTIKKYSQAEMDRHHHLFRANEQYFRAKWGGAPGTANLYKVPFDGLI